MRGRCGSSDCSTRSSSGTASLADVIIPPKDQVTAGWLRSNSVDAPLTHELQKVSYLKYDAREWASRNHKYKQEVVRYGQLARAWQEEVNQLEQNVQDETEELRLLSAQAEQQAREYEELLAIYKQEQRERDEAESLYIAARRRRDKERKLNMELKNEISDLSTQVAATQHEAQRKYAKYLEAWSEKERVIQDRERIEAEKSQVEKATEEGLKKVERLHNVITDTRREFQRGWIDAKEMDITGLLRATKITPGEAEWLSVRTRSVPKGKPPRWTKTRPAKLSS
ncbi:moesin [Cystoisospora suis]|uniref:Moesin n=1 Tax=Cystoisospora suis TaxID=483139 RepID=A0A2C6KUS3_9APIC|nr:moesin [Cystoisospora suis]